MCGATGRQHEVAEVACYRFERTLMGGCWGGSVHPGSVLELAQNEVDGEFGTDRRARDKTARLVRRRR